MHIVNKYKLSVYWSHLFSVTGLNSYWTPFCERDISFAKSGGWTFWLQNSLNIRGDIQQWGQSRGREDAGGGGGGTIFDPFVLFDLGLLNPRQVTVAMIASLLDHSICQNQSIRQWSTSIMCEWVCVWGCSRVYVGAHMRAYVYTYCVCVVMNKRGSVFL